MKLCANLISLCVTSRTNYETCTEINCFLVPCTVDFCRYWLKTKYVDLSDDIPGKPKLKRSCPPYPMWSPRNAIVTLGPLKS